MLHEPRWIHMRPLVTPESMAKLDRHAIDAGTAQELLMDRAGRGVARGAIAVLGGRYGKKVVVVCGKGNNGGDGFAAARVLRAEGVGVRCLFVGDPDEVEGAARHHLELMRRRGVPIEAYAAGANGDDDSALEQLAEADVVIDAIFGTGFRGRVEGAAADVVDAINGSGAAVVAVDIPSGVDGATGAVEGSAVRADLTVTMAAQKFGTAVGKGAVHAGVVEIVDIGISVFTAQGMETTAQEVARLLPHRDPDAHKRSRGAVAVLAGSKGMSGAAVLVARGAMRAGAGYVTVGTPETAESVVTAALPEALTRGLTPADVLDADSLDGFKDVLDRATALVIGPGLGRGAPQRDLVTKVLREVDHPVVVDADALNVLSADTQPLRDRSRPTMITPHPAELARLLDSTVEEIENDRVSAVTRAAEEFGCTVVLKGHRTIIAPGVVVNPTGNEILATAGTGDVLSGVLGTLLAAGLDPDYAAVAGTFIHGLAGELAPAGAVASDIADALPDAFELVGR